MAAPCKNLTSLLQFWYRAYSYCRRKTLDVACARAWTMLSSGMSGESVCCQVPTSSRRSSTLVRSDLWSSCCGWLCSRVCYQSATLKLTVFVMISPCQVPTSSRRSSTLVRSDLWSSCCGWLCSRVCYQSVTLKLTVFVMISPCQVPTSSRRSSTLVRSDLWSSCCGWLCSRVCYQSVTLKLAVFVMISPLVDRNDSPLFCVVLCQVLRLIHRYLILLGKISIK